MNKGKRRREASGFRRFLPAAIALTLLAALLLTPLSGALAEYGWLYGHPFPLDATELDLSGEEIASASECVAALAPFQNARRVSLGGCLPLAELYQLVTACPQIAFTAQFTCNRQTYSTQAVYADFGKKPPNSTEELEMFLRVASGLQQLDMFRFDITVEQMEALSKRYPGVKFGWTVPINKSRSLPSNATAYSTRHSHLIKTKDRNSSEDFAVLSHCPDLLALDLGHSAIDDLSFLRQFPNLKVLILADNQISDLSVLAELTQLEYLELFMNDITDITPLAQLKNLRDLNLCYNKISDISPLYELPSLERCWLSHNQISGMDKARLKSNLRNVKLNFTSRLSTQEGWRVGSHYETIKKMFKGNQYLPFPD